MYKILTLPWSSFSKKSASNSRVLSPLSVAVGATTRKSGSATSKFVPTLSVVFSAALLLLLILHLFWVNTYASKGFTLSEVQESINEQTNLQKKLMFKQAQLNSSITFADVNETGLIPITQEEFITSNQLTSR